jgi:hypothetical protein
MNPEQPQEGRLQRLSQTAMRAVRHPRVRASVALVVHYSEQMKRSLTIRFVRYLLVAAAIAAALLLGRLLGAL